MKKKLNIAILGTVSLPIPPFKGYGGTQRGIYDFITHLNEKKHKVHLYGPKDSNVKNLENVVLHSFIKKSLWIPENNLSRERKRELSKEHYFKTKRSLKYIDKKEHLDIINIRTDNLKFIEEIIKNFGANRIVYSLHNIKNQSRVETLKNLKIWSVAHCRNHKREHSNLQNIKVIMYGINIENYPFSNKILSKSKKEPRLKILKELKQKKEDYLINLGAIGKHKGQKTCIELAKKTENNLIIAGTPQDRTNKEKTRYFEEEVKPFVNNENIFYFGNADEEQKKELLKYAKGFLFPSGFELTTWNEPFGRAPVESLACGTPVVAYRKGSMEEIIFDSFNGYLFDTTEEAIKQIKSLDKIDRENCRKTAVKKFNSKRVAEEYLELFYEMINNQ